MLHLQLTSGAPDEPDTGDWGAVCNTPGPGSLFKALFSELSSGLPEASPAELREDETHRVHTIWLGSEACGVRVTETESVETTALPMYCIRETFGLPGMKVIWNFKLEYAGQLGYVAFRHEKLVCTFDTPADERRFAEIWQSVIGKTPQFGPVA